MDFLNGVLLDFHCAIMSVLKCWISFECGFIASVVILVSKCFV